MDLNENLIGKHTLNVIVALRTATAETILATIEPNAIEDDDVENVDARELDEALATLEEAGYAALAGGEWSATEVGRAALRFVDAPPEYE